ncbi:MAG TPA: phage head closure protein [Candidatus Onthocola stercoravium]|nr:phage head closure protein [Candidatus Onthocola stercoravium]
MINAGKYNKKITIVKIDEEFDKAGFKVPPVETVILNTWASVKTTKGYTLIQNNSDFEKAYTNFTIRFPNVEITRDMFVKYAEKIYSIEYLNNIDEKGIELEIQAKVVKK